MSKPESMEEAIDDDICPECEGSGNVTVICRMCDGSGWIGGVPGGEICCGGTDTACCARCRGDGTWHPELDDGDYEEE